MPYCITLRSRTDARITGWYDGSGARWSTDHNRQKVFDKKSDAGQVCHELRSLCPRNAEVISIEAKLDDPSADTADVKQQLLAASPVETWDPPFGMRR